jgi:N-acetyltransferase
MRPTTVLLAGDLVILEPLSPEHHDGLVSAVCDGELWRQWYTTIPSPTTMAVEIERRLALQDAGTMVPFATRRASDGRVLGMTTFLNIDAGVPRAEIGATWLAASAQRTGVNTEAKLLMLAHAFDEWGCVRVEFRTHALNAQSRRAIERTGGQLEGILRQHLRLPNGLLRDTAQYAILDREWPTVRVHLRALLDAHA